jgi:hypothetical protein
MVNQDQETLGQTSPVAQAEYNKVRADEFLSLRSRFYKQFPIDHECDEAFEDAVFREIKKLQSKNNKYEIALDHLARLGNGEYLGNSIGNVIAKNALGGDT